ncbi:MAG: hypothetical protein KatS3mg121_0144 [Gammaproteobacteria bacterium]|nr:MAG: hypothetical protein KatS3mg121_0144 [Gammaproteobacteria bacterium]
MVRGLPPVRLRQPRHWRAWRLSRGSTELARAAWRRGERHRAARLLERADRLAALALAEGPLTAAAVWRAWIACTNALCYGRAAEDAGARAAALERLCQALAAALERGGACAAACAAALEVFGYASLRLWRCQRFELDTPERAALTLGRWRGLWRRHGRRAMPCAPGEVRAVPGGEV